MSDLVAIVILALGMLVVVAAIPGFARLMPREEGTR